MRRSVMGFALGALAAAAACVGDDPGGGPGSVVPDASAIDAPASDVEVATDAGVEAGRPCNLEEPFGVPTLVTSVSTVGSEGVARETADGLGIYFSRADDAGVEDIYRAERADASAAFAPAALLFPPLDAGRRSAPSITADGRTLYYEVIAPDAGVRIHAAQRGSLIEAFASGAPWSAASINTVEYSPYAISDGSAIYLVTAAPSAQYRVYRVKRTATGLGAPELQFDPFPAPSALGAPVVSADELTLYVALGYPERASVDIYRARRTSKSDLFGAPEPVAQINDPVANDFPSWVSDDHCTMLLLSNRANGAGGTDIWEAKRPK